MKKLKVIYKSTEDLLNGVSGLDFRLWLESFQSDEIEFLVDETYSRNKYAYNISESNLPMILSIVISTIAICLALTSLIL